MPASKQEVTGTLLKHLQDNFTTLPVRYPNSPFEPKVDGASGWVWATVQYGESIQETIVDRTSDAGQRTQGFLFLQIFVPVNTGLAVIDPVADELSDLYNKAVLSILTLGTALCCGVPQKVQVGTSPEGTWLQQNVNIPFHYTLGL